ncbi:S-adenosylmethionine decarboxylase family protein [Streptomyces specialis]|uniref:S-adenosylmethionine decarboxylase family protein n=1 Tax=Streptomyces specialis TaxID=498367 RepID=UPI000AF524E3|nr:S-adenosylmethionine decarboxylase [Streptomyces specialis]
MTTMICVAYDLLDCARPDPGPDELITAMRKAADLLGTHIRGELAVPFRPHGTTCVLVLAESHLITSTWPEHRLTHIDLTTCRADTPPRQEVGRVGAGGWCGPGRGG